MYNFLTKNGQTLAFAVGLVSVVIFLVTAVSGVNSAGLAGADLSQMKEEIPTMNFFNIGLSITIFLLLACFALLLLFILVDIGKFPKQMGRALLAVGVLVIAFIALRATSAVETGGVWDRLANDFSVTEGASKTISGGIKTTGLLAFGAIAIMVVSEIRNFFK
ncbi:MAG TPA: hypothetical protein PKD85_04610 [Saprospiraceae bacterium]|nr:hypothetical protein [Saprospiraceae bacterium]